eukprot:4459645-Pyramimonas_sp.AAC.1
MARATHPGSRAKVLIGRRACDHLPLGPPPPSRPHVSHPACCRPPFSSRARSAPIQGPLLPPRLLLRSPPVHPWVWLQWRRRR